jgi:hypothetical protein
MLSDVLLLPLLLLLLPYGHAPMLLPHGPLLFPVAVPPTCPQTHQHAA